jgi:hypothetical protein
LLSAGARFGADRVVSAVESGAVHEYRCEQADRKLDPGLPEVPLVAVER